MSKHWFWIKNPSIGGNVGWECPIGLGAPPSPPLVATILIATKIEYEAWATTYGYIWTCKGYLANKNYSPWYWPT